MDVEVQEERVTTRIWVVRFAETERDQLRRELQTLLEAAKVVLPEGSQFSATTRLADDLIDAQAVERRTTTVSAADKKFSDDDVRDNVELPHQAWRYAMNYTGDWEPMAAAHDLAVERANVQDLPVAVARTVLNVMRTDPAAQHLVPEAYKAVQNGKVFRLDDFRRVPESHPHRNWGSIYEDEVDLEESPPKTTNPRTTTPT